jgi:transcriptional regulator with XRE-family HTH domain
MKAQELLVHARKSAGLSQRDLAAQSGFAQPAIARIESGASIPRYDTLQRLLDACNTRIEVAPRLGVGLDRSAIRKLLELTPTQRVEMAAREANTMAAMGL